MVRTCFILFLCLITSAAFCQQSSRLDGLGLEVNPFYGKVLKHTKKFLLPIPEHSTGVDLNLVYQTYGKKDWEQRRRYPVIGLAISYVNYGIDSVYGRCIGLYPNLTVPLITSNKLSWIIRIGDGIGFVSKRYDRFPIWDTMNSAIGSHVNDFASFFTDIRYHINKHWDVQAGINFNHISNGSYRQPNLGINLLGYHAGIRYFPTNATPTRIHKELPKLPNRWLFQGRASIAFTQMEASQGPTYPVYLATAYVSRRWLSKNKMFLGLDYSYHEAVQAFLRNNEIFSGQENRHSWKSAVVFGNEFLVGRFGLILQVGVYVKQTYLAVDPYYQKLGGHFYLVRKEKGPLKELFVSALLKTHKSNAELGEFGLGFGF